MSKNTNTNKTITLDVLLERLKNKPDNRINNQYHTYNLNDDDLGNVFVDDDHSTTVDDLDDVFDDDYSTTVNIDKKTTHTDLAQNTMGTEHLTKTSFFNIDKKIFNDNNRWNNFINFHKQLDGEIQSKYDSEIIDFLHQYEKNRTNNNKNTNDTKNNYSTFEWIDSRKLQDSQRKIAADKDRQHTSCFRNIQLNKNPLTIQKKSNFQQLVNEFPNFHEVIQYYQGFFSLSKSRPKHHYLAPRPILLLGNPGIGKTRFAKKLSKVFNTTYKMLDCNSITSGHVLTGHNASWRSADAGFVFRTLAPSESLSPIILLDEVDKMTNREHSPFATLHQLLEPENASTLYDEFLDLEFNASTIIYILTANDANGIPESLLSRMNVFHITNPTPQQMRPIAQNIFTELLSGSTMFKKELGDDVLNTLSTKSPRDVSQILSRNLFNQAAIQKKKKNNTFLLIDNEPHGVKFGF